MLTLEPRDLWRGLTNDRLHLILMPTEACNFRCVYCYEDFQSKRMRPEVVRGVQNLLTRRASALRSLRLSWFGGEPLLAVDVVKEVMRHACDLSAQYPEISLESDMTTNAYRLGPELFAELVDLGVRVYQISFDGPREWHDRKRVLAGGGPTFDRIWGNLESLRNVKADYEITVRLHVDRDNHAALPEFVRQYAQTFGGDRRFRLFFRLLGCLGGANDPSLPVFEVEEGQRAVRALREQANDLGIRSITVDDLDAICYATQGNSFVVRADGGLGKCTVALSHPNNEVGRIESNGTLSLDGAKISHWMRGIWSQKTEELECPMRGYADPVPTPAASTVALRLQ